MGNSYALLAGIGIAIVDALPVLGSGTVFFPWIIIAAISRDWKKIGILILLYALCQMIRHKTHTREIQKIITTCVLIYAKPAPVNSRKIS